MKKYDCTDIPKSFLEVEKDIDSSFHIAITNDFDGRFGRECFLNLSKENAQDLANYLQYKIDADRIDNVKDAMGDLKNIMEDLNDSFDVIKKKFNEMQEEINNID